MILCVYMDKRSTLYIFILSCFLLISCSIIIILFYNVFNNFSITFNLDRCMLKSKVHALMIIAIIIVVCKDRYC